MVVAAVLFNYWFLRAESAPVAYLNDSSIHQQMVRFATAQIRSGHLPQTRWFPFLGLGSPQFLHYQGLPATITGLLGVVLGPNRAFAWSLYLLLSLWPLSVYVGARAFRLGRWTSAFVALLSPFLMSKVGVGFETLGYVWIGYGLWAQLWAMLTLPLAWGFSWQAITEGRRYFWAVLFVSLTVMFHFETGYLALVALPIFPFLVLKGLRARLLRAALVAALCIAASAWATVPLIVMGSWAAVNEILRGTPLENGYGARQVMAWLIGGQLLDAGRLPVITMAAAVGLVVCVFRWRRDPRGRAVIALLVVSLLLSFGRTTFGSVVDIIPGSKDIFMRRFMMGVQLSSLLLAGIGIAAVGAFASRRLQTQRPELLRRMDGRGATRVGVVALVAAVLVYLAPAWSQVASVDRDNAASIAAQQRADRLYGARLAPLLARIKASGGGRTYAGAPNNWGATFTVGDVPVFKYLESQDIDEVGYTLRTASLMTDPEFYFDQANPGDYVVFGVRYLLEPDGASPPVPARLLMVRNPYALWEIPQVGYVRVAQAVGTLTANRSDIGTRSVPYLRSALPGLGQTLTVDFAGAHDGVATMKTPGRAGQVVSEHSDLVNGTAQASVVMERRALVVLSASFDPGWNVRVDGHQATAVMVAPALVGVEVGPGRHMVNFTYVGFGWYAPLIALSVVALGGAALFDVRRARRGRSIASSGPRRGGAAAGTRGSS